MPIHADCVVPEREKESAVNPELRKAAGARPGGGYAYHTALNILGQVLPMLVGMLSIPVIIRHIGTERFGIVTIAWMLIGYCSLFDMGLGRALTQVVAEKLGKNESHDIPALFWTSLALMLSLSLVGACAMAGMASTLVHGVLKIPVELQRETVASLYILAFSIPCVVLTSAFIGFLSAYNRFDIINAIRIPMGIFGYAAPLIVLPFSHNLIAIMFALAVGRVITCLAHFRASLAISSELGEKIVIRKDLLKPLFRFGGWLTVSNIIGPFMVYFDRFLIGSLVSVAAVAYYTTPYEVITKLWIIPGALLSVLFPAFAAHYGRDRCYAAGLLDRAVKYLLLILFPIVFVVVVWARDGLALWLGDSFAGHGYQALRWLAMGVFMNSIAQVPFAFIQGGGKPDITTKLHLGELLVYAPLLWYLVKLHGINGAAMAWYLRVTVDCLLLMYSARRLSSPAPGFSGGTLLAFLTASLCLLLAMILPGDIHGGAVAAGILISCVIAGWKLLLGADERTRLRAKLLISK